MSTVLLPPGVNTIAVNECIKLVHFRKLTGYFRIRTAVHTTYLCTFVSHPVPLTVPINWGILCYISVILIVIYDLMYVGQEHRCKKYITANENVKLLFTVILQYLSWFGPFYQRFGRPIFVFPYEGISQDTEIVRDILGQKFGLCMISG